MLPSKESIRFNSFFFIAFILFLFFSLLSSFFYISSTIVCIPQFIWKKYAIILITGLFKVNIATNTQEMSDHEEIGPEDFILKGAQSSSNTPTIWETALILHSPSNSHNITSVNASDPSSCIMSSNVPVSTLWLHSLVLASFPWSTSIVMSKCLISEMLNSDHYVCADLFYSPSTDWILLSSYDFYFLFFSVRH